MEFSTRIKGEFKFLIAPRFDWGGYEFHMIQDMKETGQIGIIQPLVISVTDAPLCEVTKPMAIFKPAELVELMDVLWKTGIRPSCGEGHIGELNATKEHLKDMKEIAFHKLGIKK
jgi:hypothetical protein